MTNLADVFQPRGVAAATAVQGHIAAVDGDDVYAILPSFDTQQRWGPLFGIADASSLSRGDDCLVVFDEDREPWLVNPAGAQGGGGPVDVDVEATAHATTTAPGSNATVAVTEPSANLFDFAFGIPRGDAGAAGAQGPAGATGSQGPKGDTGATGTTGSQGPAGAQGPQGIKGDTGATGSQGPQGVKGDTGAQGVQGPQGNPGTAGTPGEKWFSGTGAPAGATGIVGDWYLNDANGDVYEKTGASAWTLRDNLTGPQGIQGPVGPSTGPAGGDLTGTYPNPQIAAGVIVDADVATANKDGVAATPSLRTLGTGAQQAAAGNDARLTNARTPTSHATTHQPGGSDPMAVDAAAATGSLRTLGTGATQAAPGNDSRLAGAMFFVGTGAPTAGVGVDGAMYLDTASLRVYGPKAAGAWPGTAIARVVPLTPTWRRLRTG